MKKFIVLLGLILIASATVKGQEVKDADLEMEPRVTLDTNFEVNGTMCRLNTVLLGDYWTQCPQGFVIGSRTVNVRPPFASTIVRCAKYEIICEK